MKKLLLALILCALLPHKVQPELPTRGSLLDLELNESRITLQADGRCDVKPDFGPAFTVQVERERLVRLHQGLLRAVPTGEATELPPHTCLSCVALWRYTFHDGNQTWQGVFYDYEASESQRRFAHTVRQELGPIFTRMQQLP